MTEPLLSPTASGRTRTAPGFALIVSGTILGIAGVDLVLPAVPDLPAVLDGSPAQAQLVLAAFVAGTALGLLAFGELGARHDQRSLLAGSLLLYAVTSALATAVPSMEALIALRVVQGAAGAAAAVFAPGMIRRLYGDARAVGALGLLGSVEALTPAFAPVAGVWLVRWFGWQGTFAGLAALALAAAVAVLVLRGRLPAGAARTPGAGGYGALLGDAVFLRYALRQACVLGALLVFVFGAPAVIVGSLEGTLDDFILMQIVGIAFFMLFANLSGRLAARFGAERMIRLGTTVASAGAGGLLLYALAGGDTPRLLAVLSIPLNVGLGISGPPGFHQAVVAARGDDARGAALVMLAILAVSALGTAAAAPFITLGLVPLAAVTAVIAVAGSVTLAVLPPLAADRR